MESQSQTLLDVVRKGSGTQDSTIPAPIADVRTGKPLSHNVGNVVSMFGKRLRVSGTRPDGSPVLTLLPSQPTGKWLHKKLDSLYNDPVYQQANDEVKSFYKRQAYDKWVVPYYKHYNAQDQMPWKSAEEFVDNSKLVQRRQDELQDEKKVTNLSKMYQSAVKETDKAIAGMSSFLGMLSRTKTVPFLSVPGSEKFYKESEQYWDKQAQGREDVIQDLGGHTLETRVSGLVADAALFEATGGRIAPSFKLLNPKTAEFGTRLLKTMWNGAVNGFFWGVSTGSKPSDVHEDVGTFALFGALGSTGGQAFEFLKSFRKVATSEVVDSTVKSATESLLKNGIKIPKQAQYNIDNVDQNKQLATAGVARVLNMMAFMSTQAGEDFANKSRMLGQSSTKGKISESLFNGQFKKLPEKEQKLLVTKLLSQLHTSQAQDQFELAKQVGPELIKEQEERMTRVVPSAAKVQKEIDTFVQQNAPGQDVVKMKLGAILPHHNTTIQSPAKDVGARISWLSKQALNKDLPQSDREVLLKSIKQEQKLLTLVKDQFDLTKTEWQNQTRHYNFTRNNKSIGRIFIKDFSDYSQPDSVMVSWGETFQRQQGHGKSMYMQMFRDLKREGKKFVYSDSLQSTEGEAVWKSLQRDIPSIKKIEKHGERYVLSLEDIR